VKKTDVALKEVTDALADHIEVVIVDLSQTLDSIKYEPDMAFKPSLFDLTDRLGSIVGDLNRAVECSSRIVPIRNGENIDDSAVDYNKAFNALL